MAVNPTPTPAPVPAATKPSKVSIAVKAFTKAITSKQAVQLEMALARYIVYAILGAEGVKHAGFLGF